MPIRFPSPFSYGTFFPVVMFCLSEYSFIFEMWLCLVSIQMWFPALLWFKSRGVECIFVCFGCGLYSKWSVFPVSLISEGGLLLWMQQQCVFGRNLSRCKCFLDTLKNCASEQSNVCWQEVAVCRWKCSRDTLKTCFLVLAFTCLKLCRRWLGKLKLNEEKSEHASLAQ